MNNYSSVSVTKPTNSVYTSTALYLAGLSFSVVTRNTPTSSRLYYKVGENEIDIVSQNALQYFLTTITKQEAFGIETTYTTKYSFNSDNYGDFIDFTNEETSVLPIYIHLEWLEFDDDGNRSSDISLYNAVNAQDVIGGNTYYDNDYKIIYTNATIKSIKMGFDYDKLALYPSYLVEKDNITGLNKLKSAATNDDCIGYIDLKESKLVLFNDYEPYIDGEDNITVTFPHYVDGESDKINHCQFGIVYNNRLFLSGNPDFPNTDWHSSPISSGLDDVGYDDFTYFSDLDYCAYGSSDTAVVGYDIYRDGDLIAVKEPSMREATLYRREYKLTEAMNYAGEVVENQGTKLYEEAFPCFDINIQGGFGGLSHKSIINYMGDTLIFTKNGIKVLSSSDTAYNNQKFLYDVSTNINPKLAQDNDLNENAFLYVFGEKLLLRTNNCTYIGEYNLKNENEYEWFVLDNVNAKAFFVVDRELYFVDTNNGIKRFNSDEFYFKDRDLIEVTVANIDTENYQEATEEDDEEYYDEITVTVAEQYTPYLVNGRKIILVDDNENYLFGYLGYFSLTNGHIDVSNSNKIEEFYDGRILYDDGGNKYVLEQYINNGFEEPNCYRLKKQDNTYYSSNAVVLLFRLDETTELYIVQMGNTISNTFTVKDKYGYYVNIENPLEIGSNNGNYNYTKAYVIPETDVEAYYETKPFDMGTITYEKTIWNYMYANDSNLASQINIGYKGSRLLGDFEIATGSREIRFDKYSFNTVSFVNDGLPHLYVRHRVIPNVTFIKFLFQNNGDTNMALTKLSLTYTIPQQARGSK